MTAHKIKVLNLYAGVGGNRRLWGDGYEVTFGSLELAGAKLLCVGNWEER